MALMKLLYKKTWNGTEWVDNTEKINDEIKEIDELILKKKELVDKMTDKNKSYEFEIKKKV